MRSRFSGQIAGMGSEEGTRVVIGRWADSPFGSFADVMIERPDGHRVLLAPTTQVATFVAQTYTFDEVQSWLTTAGYGKARRKNIFKAGSPLIVARQLP